MYVFMTMFMHADDAYDAYDSGIRESVYDSGYPSSPSMEASFVLLNSSGQLTTPEERARSPYAKPTPPTTYKAEEFCMAGVWDNDGTVKGINDELPVGVAVMCKPCESEVGRSIC